jgi:AraC-like DNA-binding protein
MDTLDKNLNDFYAAVTENSFSTRLMDMPSDFGTGNVSQITTKKGIVVSDWQMQFSSDMIAQGQNSDEYVQIIFCMGEGLTWGILGEDRTVAIKKGESCVRKEHGKTEYTYYAKQCDFRFKSIRIPVGYFIEILNDYFKTKEAANYEKKLFQSMSKISVTPCLERILAEIKDFMQYRGGLGSLYLESKIMELLSVYLCEVLELNMLMPGKKCLYRTDRASIMNAKKIIDDHIAYAPTYEALAKQAGMSVSKLSRGFCDIIGMPIHAYIINQRLEIAARLLLEGDLDIGRIAALVGYTKPSNFSDAFKKKYGIIPKQYKARKKEI